MTSERYYPILTAKRGEFVALSHLPESIKATMTPVLDVPPIARKRPPRPGEPAPEPMSPERYVKTYLLHSIPTYWSRERDIFVDLDGFERYRPGDLHPVSYLAAQMSHYPGQRGLVVSNLSTDEYRQAALGARDQFAATALRVHVDPSMSAASTSHDVAGLRDELGLNPFATDLIVDLGDLAEYDPDRLVAFALEHVRAVPEATKWRTFVLAATAAPAAKRVRSGRFGRFDRSEWSLWRKVADRVEWAVVFADYGATGLRPHSEEPQHRPGPNIRYTAESKILFLKGRMNGSEPDDDDVVGPSYPDLCRDLTKFDEYGSRNQSWGDGQMAKARRNELGRGGGPEQWVQFASSHHLVHVAERLEQAA